MENVEIEPKIAFNVLDDIDAFNNSNHGAAFTATANANIALIKYWGKRDETLILPYASSLSLTLDGFSTTTKVRFDDCLEEDSICLNGVNFTGDLLQSSERARIVKMLDIVRKMAGIKSKAQVVSVNTVPTAAGLKLSPRNLSILARKGSGSACRSIYGGLVLWNAGTSDETSYAEPIETPEELQLAMVAVILNSSKKKISSREAMRRTVETSPIYADWIKNCKKDLNTALSAIKNCDIQALGEVSERNALGMHDAMRAAAESVNYLTDETHVVLNVVRKMRDESGFPVWATMDAGPNVKVLTSAEQVLRVKNELSLRVLSEIKRLRESQESPSFSSFAQSNPQFVIARPGSGVSIRRES